MPVSDNPSASRSVRNRLVNYLAAMRALRITIVSGICDTAVVRRSSPCDFGLHRRLNHPRRHEHSASYRLAAFQYQQRGPCRRWPRLPRIKPKRGLRPRCSIPTKNPRPAERSDYPGTCESGGFGPQIAAVEFQCVMTGPSSNRHPSHHALQSWPASDAEAGFFLFSADCAR
jgi:hypothetical protein